MLQETETQRKFIMFSQKKAALIFQKKETPKKFLMFKETENLKSFLYFRKRNFLLFQEKELSYISGKVYSEPKHFRTRSIFKTLTCLELEACSEHCQTSTMERFAKIATYNHFHNILRLFYVLTNFPLEIRKVSKLHTMIPWCPSPLPKSKFVNISKTFAKNLCAILHEN